MKFLIDAHLPASIGQYFQGHDVIHTSALKEGNLTSDALINETSIVEERIRILD